MMLIPLHTAGGIRYVNPDEVVFVGPSATLANTEIVLSNNATLNTGLEVKEVWRLLTMMYEVGVEGDLFNEHQRDDACFAKSCRSVAESKV